ncbi:type I DNA topoisomerase [Patescibacteria group bacterium]|nr:type I DNA topoisomerase [Patescibacteria group bacterium]
MTTLVIVESPAKAKTIEKYLGKEYRVKASVGHVRDLPKSNLKALDIPGGFIPHYEISRGKEKVIAELREAAKKAKVVLLATDPDREGEAIAWHVAETLKDIHKKPQRIVFHEITEAAVKEALEHPRPVDLNLKEAQEARRVLDRLVGYDLSGLIWKKVRYGLSAGRVQSPALRIIMEREREIRAFIPETYFSITAHTTTEKKAALILTCDEEPRDKAFAETILSEAKANSWSVEDVKETEQKRTTRPPFTTSTLQQVASTRLGFAPSRTMGVAQKLYEAGLITYMRTDSVTISQVAQKQILGVVEKEYGKKYVAPRAFKTTSKSAQEAHEAIRPTNVSVRDAGMNEEQKRLYALIWTRAVASQMQDALVKRTKITATVASKKEIPSFSTTGSRILFDGWLKADPAARGEDVEVPLVQKGEKLDLVSIDMETKETQPPSRYTEAGLIKELEKRGIGRPSTYASTMKTIIDRGYVEKNGRTLLPTDTGDVVSSFLETHFAEYISDTFTSEMEDELDDIALGKRTYEKTLREFYTPFTKAVKAKDKIEKLTNLGEADAKHVCPLCQSGMIIKLGRGGKFLSCERFPDCMGARMIDGTEIKADEPIGTDPKTELPIFVLSGRFGPYVQLGEKTKENKTPRRASIPKGKNLAEVTLEDALVYLSLPRVLGEHPDTHEPITASVGRFGPFVVHQSDFRSLKGADNPYTIELARALEIFKEPKKGRAGETLLREVGLNPKTKKPIKIFESKSGRYFKRGFKRISIAPDIDIEKMTVAEAIELQKQ